MLKLRNYQENHISNLKKKIDGLLDLNLTPSPIIVFKSPTGSGKTIMMAELIKRLADHRSDKKEISFIWITVHTLHDQSKEKMEKYYANLEIVECVNFNDLQDKEIKDKEVLFFNWQSINKKKNIFIRENETNFNLSKVIENIKYANRKIILIIDESHHTASSKKSREVIKNIDPDITIEVSATPKILNVPVVDVPLQDVKKEEMVKKTVRLNYRLINCKKTTDEIILETAIKKRKELQKMYQNERSNVNPLILIQLSNSHPNKLDKKDTLIKLLDSRFKINTDNGKLAIYLSAEKDKINLENIEKNENDVEVLIFKQAIAVGWDCPRSSILVLFRKWKEYEFSIQTIGRIIRMPEIKYYKNDELNHAFVYTNVSNIDIAEDVKNDYITVYESKRNNDLYNDVNLESIYITRPHEKTRLTGQFSDIFKNAAKQHNLSSKIITNVSKLKNKILVNGKIENLDKTQTVNGGNRSIISSDLETQEQFDAFLSECSEGFARVHSMERIRTALYTFFECTVKIDNLLMIQKIILDSNNIVHIRDIIDRSKDLFRTKIANKTTKTIENISKWNVPINIEYTSVYIKKKYVKSIMFPAYIQINIKNEIIFMNFLDKQNNVKWWFKNGINDKKYFAIKYNDPETGIDHAFYVDFIIYMNDGNIGLFDTKGGFTATDQQTRLKAEALSRYIRDNSSKKLFGGIAVFVQNKWKYNDNEEYHYDEQDFSDWKLLKLNI